MTPAVVAALRLADALLREGRSTEARRLLEQSAGGDSAVGAPEVDALLAQAQLQDGDAGAALASVRRALAARPEWPEALHLKGRALRDLDRLDEAAAAIAAALHLRPGDPGALTSLGIVEYRRDRLVDSRVALATAIRLAPDDLRAWRAYAETLQAAGAESEAIEAWRRWTNLSGASPAARARFGAALADAHRWREAEAELSAAASSPAAAPAASLRLARVRSERGDADGALQALARAAEQAPGALTPRIGRALLLPQIYRSIGDVAHWRSRYVAGLERLEADRPALLRAPDELWRLDWSNFYLGYQGENDVDLQRRYAALVAAVAQVAAPKWMRPLDRRRPSARLRVGFASSFFRTCTVGAYFGSWLSGLDRSRFEVHAFHFGNESDATTSVMRGAVERFARVGPGAQAIADAIHRAELDVLVYPQLGMDGRDATLASLRLAPVQCVAWGHPETTGSPAIDCFFSCETMEPADGAAHYVERLALLPGLGTRYERPVVRQATRAEFGLPEGARLHACPHTLFKNHPETDAVFASILAADARARMVFCVDPTLPSTERFARRVRGVLELWGVDPARALFQPLRTPAEFRAMLSTCDVMVDTSRWSGGHTALDALAAGLPIVVAPGKLMRGRQSAGMLRQIGAGDLVVDALAAVAPRALEVAEDSSRFRQRILAGRDALFGRSEPIAALGRRLAQLAGRDDLQQD